MGNYRKWCAMTFGNISQTVFVKIAKNNNKKIPWQWMWNCGNFAKNYQTHLSLNLSYFHIVLASDFIKTLNKKEVFELLILYSRFRYLLTFLIYHSVSFMLFLFLFTFFNGCVLWNLQEARVGDVIARVQEQWNMI